ncbi:DNA primase [Motiliproteus coralliicola]|uniref:DNA primase n=1 Tax=Motiliproteus coralliicola TaxID=2283196 RepID=A0A369WCX3_9GAMM|nr:DNA primase [Motiliproteus coralliicola]RDE19880.1 DNA primase [Motiliproteus coralliicola]
MAGRIPQDFIDDLLHRTDIVDVVEERIKLKRTGKNYSGLCPFHQEKTPSFSVNPDKQFYYCFGCGAGGNALGFVMEYDRLEFREAVETLAKRHGLEIPAQSNGPQHRADKERQQSYALLQQASDYYQQQLREHPERDKAVDYLKQRGLSGSIAKRFGIGYAPPGWDNLLKHIGTEQQNKLDDAGMLIMKPEQKRTYDRFRDRIMFPIIDMRGRTIAFGGRVLTDEKPKYLNSPETHTFKKHEELYGLYQARQANRELHRVLIVEGYMDVVALAQFGITNAVATLGTATSANHLQRLFKLMPEVVFCFDGDNAGRQAAQRALETALPLMEDGRQAKFLFLPDGEDPDSMVRSEGTEAFNRRVDQALPLSEFLFDSLSDSLDLESGEGRARLSALAVPMIDKIPGQVFQQLMRQQLSEISGLERQFFTPKAEPSPPSAAPQNSAPSHRAPDYSDYDPGYGDYDAGPAEPPSSFKARTNRHRPAAALATTSNGARALQLLLHNPKLALKVDLETSDALGSLQHTEQGLLKALIEQLRNDPNIPTAILLLQWRDSDYGPQLKQLASKELLISSGEQREQEFLGCLEQLLRQTREAELDYLKEKQQNQQLSSKDKKRLTELLLAGQRRNHR